MRVQEIIRNMLDMIDGVEIQQPDISINNYSDRDVKRFKQIVDLADRGEETEYSNTPKEQYADITSVTVDAGADGGISGTKEPEDIRGNSFRIYPSQDRESK